LCDPLAPAPGISTNVTQNRPTTNTPRYPHIKNDRKFSHSILDIEGRLRAVPSNRFPEPNTVFKAYEDNYLSSGKVPLGQKSAPHSVQSL